MGVDSFIEYLRGLAGKTLYTLDYKRPFTFESLIGNQVIITTSRGNPRSINLENTISAYKHLLSKGELTRTEIMTHYSNFNPAYVAAILAGLDYVDFTLRPIRLFLVSK